MGFTEPTNNFKYPSTIKLMQLREDLANLPWFHFMEKIYLRSEIRLLEQECFAIGLEIALNDLVDMGLLERI